MATHTAFMPGAKVEAPTVWAVIASWLTTVDHKRIGILYGSSAFIFFLIAGIEALIMRLQLARPDNNLVSAQTFNELFTMHGTTMIFLAIMPMSAAFFNYMIPLMIGARDVAFPRLNALSYWIFISGGLFLHVSFLAKAVPDGGWFGYANLTSAQFSPSHSIDFWMLGVQILGISSMLAGFNFLVTIINMRAPGMTLMRMPVFIWMSFVTQFLIVLAFPAITVALILLMFDRFFGTLFYVPVAGGDPLLWQHLFWIFGHPEVYILVLPAFGLVSEVLPTYSKKPLFGYPVMVYSGILIAVLGFGVWAHHMFAVGMGPIADTFFGLTTMLIAIPTGVKIFNWIATMAQGAIRYTTAMLFGISLVALFTIGGISGIMHSSPPADLQQTDTYFIVAHFHYVLFGGSIMGIFAGIYHYFPKVMGRLMDEKLGKIHFWLTFIAMNLTFFPMHFSGMLGMPRRIYTYDAGQGWDLYNAMSSAGAMIFPIAMAIFIYNFFVSRKRGEIAGSNPWGAGTLEWTIPSPPPEYNFAKIPTVTSRYPIWEGKEVDHADARINAQEGKTPADLGIVMPYNSIKPLFVALGLVIMFCGLITTRALIGVGAALMIFSLYSWLLSPLEPEHH